MKKKMETTILFRVRGDSVSRLIMGVTRVTLWTIGVINLHAKSP